jgi:hypothetical protein
MKRFVDHRAGNRGPTLVHYVLKSYLPSVFDSRESILTGSVPVADTFLPFSRKDISQQLRFPVACRRYYKNLLIAGLYMS